MLTLCWPFIGSTFSEPHPKRIELSHRVCTTSSRFVALHTVKIWVTFHALGFFSKMLGTISNPWSLTYYILPQKEIQLPKSCVSFEEECTPIQTQTLSIAAHIRQNQVRFEVLDFRIWNLKYVFLVLCDLNDFTPTTNNLDTWTPNFKFLQN